MFDHVVLAQAASIVPMLAFVFVGALLLYKLYVKIRSKFNVTVNCWFCNQNTRVPYVAANSWHCPHCEQYNGFTKDGDYNREIYQQLDCSNVSNHSCGTLASALETPRNGFCNVCNEAQRIKVEKLAQFEAKKESRFDEELKAYKAELEKQYRLCETCERHLRRVLREKKKMVLGSKFLDFIIKGAESLKQPHFQQMRDAQQQQWKWRLALVVSLLSVLNICCHISLLPALKSEDFVVLFGEFIGQKLFLYFSHLLAFCRALSGHASFISNWATLQKVGLFVRTLCMMLLYNMGLKMPQIARLSFASVYVLACPFMIFGMAFGYNIVDGFRLTRFTFLLALWSAFAGGLVGEWLQLTENVLMLLASIITLALSALSRVEASPKLHDTTANSFHKIFSEDLLSDEDNISMLSQEFNYSTTSSNRSRLLRPTSPLTISTALHSPRLTKSPITSSTLSLNNISHATFSPNSSFKSCFPDLPLNHNTTHSHYAASSCNFATCSPRLTQPTNGSFFTSNSTFNNSERPHSSMLNLGANNALNSSFISAYSQGGQSLVGDELNTSFRSTASKLGHAVGDCFNYNMSNTASLHSPFSLSSNALYAPKRAAKNLLSPSRFSNSCLASNASTTTWLSNSFLDQPNSIAARKRKQIGSFTSVMEENLSRASSQSSGFESQNGRMNVSRENSFCPDANDFIQRTKSPDISRAFQPIEPGVCDQTPRPFLLNGNNGLEDSASLLWKAPVRRRNLLTANAFNLCKINEELPTIRNGDLLKKWKESQVVA